MVKKLSEFTPDLTSGTITGSELVPLSTNSGTNPKTTLNAIKTWATAGLGGGGANLGNSILVAPAASGDTTGVTDWVNLQAAIYKLISTGGGDTGALPILQLQGGWYYLNRPLFFSNVGGTIHNTNIIMQGTGISNNGPMDHGGTTLFSMPNASGYQITNATISGSVLTVPVGGATYHTASDGTQIGQVWPGTQISLSNSNPANPVYQSETANGSLGQWTRVLYQLTNTDPQGRPGGAGTYQISNGTGNNVTTPSTLYLRQRREALIQAQGMWYCVFRDMALKSPSYTLGAPVCYATFDHDPVGSVATCWTWQSGSQGGAGTKFQHNAVLGDPFIVRAHNEQDVFSPVRPNALPDGVAVDNKTTQAGTQFKVFYVTEVIDAYSFRFGDLLNGLWTNPTSYDNVTVTSLNGSGDVYCKFIPLRMLDFWNVYGSFAGADEANIFQNLFIHGCVQGIATGRQSGYLSDTMRFYDIEAQECYDTCIALYGPNSFGNTVIGGRFSGCASYVKGWGGGLRYVEGPVGQNQAGGGAIGYYPNRGNPWYQADIVIGGAGSANTTIISNLETESQRAVDAAGAMGQVLVSACNQRMNVKMPYTWLARGGPYTYLSVEDCNTDWSSIYPSSNGAYLKNVMLSGDERGVSSAIIVDNMKASSHQGEAKVRCENVVCYVGRDAGNWGASFPYFPNYPGSDLHDINDPSTRFESGWIDADNNYFDMSKSGPVMQPFDAKSGTLTAWYDGSDVSAMTLEGGSVSTRSVPFSQLFTLTSNSDKSDIVAGRVWLSATISNNSMNVSSATGDSFAPAGKLKDRTLLFAGSTFLGVINGDQNGPTYGVGTYTVDAANGSPTVAYSPIIVNWPSHGLTPNRAVAFRRQDIGGRLPMDMWDNQPYYVSKYGFTANSFLISKTVDGTPMYASAQSLACCFSTHGYSTQSSTYPYMWARVIPLPNLSDRGGGYEPYQSNDWCPNDPITISGAGTPPIGLAKQATCTMNAAVSSTEISCTNHGLLAGGHVMFTGTVATGVTANKLYSATPIYNSFAVTITLGTPIQNACTINAVGHGLANGAAIKFTRSTWPTTRSTTWPPTNWTGITQDQVYYVVNSQANTFQFSSTVGGAAQPVRWDPGNLYCQPQVSDKFSIRDLSTGSPVTFSGASQSPTMCPIFYKAPALSGNSVSELDLPLVSQPVYGMDYDPIEFYYPLSDWSWAGYALYGAGGSSASNGTGVYQLNKGQNYVAIPDGVIIATALPRVSTIVNKANPGTYNAVTPSATVTVSAASPAVVAWNNHGLVNGRTVQFETGGTLPTGVSANTAYYVVNAATNTFNLATSFGGTAINTTGSQGTSTCTAIGARPVLMGPTYAPVWKRGRSSDIPLLWFDGSAYMKLGSSLSTAGMTNGVTTFVAYMQSSGRGINIPMYTGMGGVTYSSSFGNSATTSHYGVKVGAGYIRASEGTVSGSTSGSVTTIANYAYWFNVYAASVDASGNWTFYRNGMKVASDTNGSVSNNQAFDMIARSDSGNSGYYLGEMMLYNGCLSPYEVRAISNGILAKYTVAH